MKAKAIKIPFAAVLVYGVSAVSASADYCSSHSHTGATVAGAVGGGVIGGLVSHGSGAAIVGGAVVGGLVGNAVARDQDCGEYHRGRGYYHDGRYYKHRKWKKDHYDYWGEPARQR